MEVSNNDNGVRKMVEVLDADIAQRKEALAQARAALYKMIDARNALASLDETCPRMLPEKRLRRAGSDNDRTIRRALLNAPGGLGITQLVEQTGLGYSSVYLALKRAPREFTKGANRKWRYVGNPQEDAS